MSAVILAGSRDDSEWESYIRAADPAAAIFERARRIYKFQQHCKAEHGKQGGSRFAEFMAERFGMAQASASHWAIIGAKAPELSIQNTKFAPEWTTIYDFIRLPEDKQIALLEAPGVIDRKAVSAIRSSEKQERKEEKQARKAPAGFIEPEIFVADIRDAPIADESIDFIITDPPYPKEFLPLYSVLSQQASRWLKPGGSLIVMCGQVHFPEVLSRLCEAMKYQWLAAYLTPGGQSVQVFPRKVNTFWKPVVWLTKGEYQGDWIGDVMQSAVNDNDKQHHEWGQSESGMANIITRWTNAGDTILDPFLGGGTTIVCAAQLGRKAIGFDLSNEAVTTTAQRLANVGAA